MMKKQYTLPLILLSLASCAKKQEVLVLDEQTHNYDSGVVIAESEFVGKRYATDTDGSVSDCSEGVGLGIRVESTLSSSSYIFNKQQEVCKKADVLFDGDLEVNRRTADPSVNITFTDKYGSISKLNNIERIAATSTVLSDSSNDYTANDGVGFAQYSQMGLLDADYERLRASEEVNKQQATFEAILKGSLQAEEEKEQTLAAARAVVRNEIAEKSEELEDQKDLALLKSKLAQDTAASSLEKLAQANINLTETQKELNALKISKQVQENNYQEKLELLEQRVADYARLSLMLKRENERLAQTNKTANNFIENDLATAEKDADAARYATMLQMAEGISVDEKLARALEDSQKKALERKSQRLQTQADTLAHHAQADRVFNKDMQDVYEALQNNMQPAFEGKIARVVGVDVNQEPDLSHVQLLLKEDNRSVDAILNEILADVQPMLGTWKLDWKLASHNLQIKDEKWNITAETTLFELFDYIKNRVKEIHGVDLKIDFYDEQRKILITDNF